MSAAPHQAIAGRLHGRCPQRSGHRRRRHRIQRHQMQHHRFQHHRLHHQQRYRPRTHSELPADRIAWPPHRSQSSCSTKPSKSPKPSEPQKLQKLQNDPGPLRTPKCFRTRREVYGRPVRKAHRLRSSESIRDWREGTLQRRSYASGLGRRVLGGISRLG